MPWDTFGGAAHRARAERHSVGREGITRPRADREARYLPQPCSQCSESLELRQLRDVLRAPRGPLGTDERR